MVQNGRAGSTAAHSVGERFAAAQNLHQSGRLAEAERIYREILVAQPQHLGALHSLGLLALQAGHGDAIRLLETAVSLSKRTPQLRYHLGLAYRAQRRLGDAEQAFAEALALDPGAAEVECALAQLAAEQGQVEAAIARYRGLLASRPGHLEALTGLGSALLGQNRFDEAIAAFGEVAERLPQVAEAQANLGKALKEAGRLEEAAARYEGAVALKPDVPHFHNDLGSVRAAQGLGDAAMEQYRQALSLSPGFADAHYNLGNALKQADRPQDAIGYFRQAVQLKPRFAEAHYNLAQLLFAEGEVAAALAHAASSHALLDTQGCRALIVQCLARSDPQMVGPALEALIIRALDEGWTGSSVLSVPGAMLLRRGLAIRSMLDRAEAAWPRLLPASELFGPGGRAALAGSRLLDSLLRNVVIADVGFERLLTGVRAALLEDMLAGARPATDLAFACVLARQCFITEHVYAETAEELAGIAKVRDGLTDDPSPHRLAVLAAYRPLVELAEAESLLDGTWPAPVAALLDQQLREPLEERRIRSTIAVLTPIEGAVSQAVQQQYEENPYPRWVAPVQAADASAAEEGPSRLALLREQARGRGTAIDILIAGCGTGQHSIEIARRYVGARVLAVDLSRTSLAYAIRMSGRLGIGNIDYAQADLLALGDLDRRFDNIESVGVLHHLGDPAAGLRVLVGLLKPNGLIRLGLYSELARRPIVAARDFIADRGCSVDADGIRHCRQALMAPSARGQFEKFQRSSDFFSMSGVRDLLFHVQEHRFTVPQLAALLAGAGLNFLGFDLTVDIARRYRARFPHDKDMIDLDCWNVFETENPDSFAAMYQFWAQKPGSEPGA